MRGKLILGIAAGISATIFGCNQTEDVYQERKTLENKTEIKNYLSANKLRADTLTTGLFYIVTNADTSLQKPKVGDEVTFSYVARRLDGTIIDSSEVGNGDVFIRSFSSTDITTPGYEMKYRFNPVPSFEVLMNAPYEKVRETDKITLLVPWSLRGSSDVSLLAPLYIPIRYDIKILKVRTQEEQINDYVAANKIVGLERNGDTGLRFVKTLSRPDSAQIEIGTTVSVVYTGKLIRNGKQFDSGTIDVNVVDPTGTASGGVVKGFNDGIAKMRYGEKAIIIFPSTLGYGATGSAGKIPAYSPLLFEVEAKSKK